MKAPKNNTMTAQILKLLLTVIGSYHQSEKIPAPINTIGPHTATGSGTGAGLGINDDAHTRSAIIAVEKETGIDGKLHMTMITHVPRRGNIKSHRPAWGIHIGDKLMGPGDAM